VNAWCITLAHNGQKGHEKGAVYVAMLRALIEGSDLATN